MIPGSTSFSCSSALVKHKVPKQQPWVPRHVMAIGTRVTFNGGIWTWSQGKGNRKIKLLKSSTLSTPSEKMSCIEVELSVEKYCKKFYNGPSHQSTTTTALHDEFELYASQIVHTAGELSRTFNNANGTDQLETAVWSLLDQCVLNQWKCWAWDLYDPFLQSNRYKTCQWYWRVNINSIHGAHPSDRSHGLMCPHHWPLEEYDPLKSFLNCLGGH